MAHLPQAKLLVLKGPLAGRSFPLTGDRFTIGRQRDSDLYIRQLEISRKHCVIESDGEDGGFRVRDLDSRHGTFVNDVPVRVHRLAHEDVVTLGSSEILFLCPPASDDGEPAPSYAEELDAESTRELTPDEAIYLQPTVPAAARGAAEDLATLYTLSRALQEETSASALAARLLETLLAVLPAERGCVLLSEPQGESRLAAVRHQDGGRDPFPLSRRLLERVLTGGTAVVADDVDRPALPGDPEGARAGVCSLLVVPLARGGQTLGAVYFDTGEPPGFAPRHLELATAAAVSAALALDNARHVAWLRSENRRLQAEQVEGAIVGESPPVRELLELLAKVARSDSTVLLLGESGTGKELAARAIHRGSARREAAFVAINCATLSESLLESELFGHEKGAFTGAVQRKPGKLEVASGGTLFLDEVGEMPLSVQARLLRVLQERTFERVGGQRPIEVDLRILAATNRDLGAMMRAHRFREDLYYRLDVIRVRLPPLRERRGDVALLARHFSALHARRLGRPLLGPSPAALALLESYGWPGNVRQLANVIERAAVLGSDELIQSEDLPEEILEASRTSDEPQLGRYQASLLATKRSLVRKALRQAGGDVDSAADLLGLHPNSLRRLIRNLGLKDGSPTSDRPS